MKYVVQPVIRGSALMPGTIPDARNKSYTLAAVHSGKVLSVRNGDVVTEQQNWDEEARQQWKIEPLSGADSGYFRIVSGHSGNVLDVRESSTENGVPILEHPWHGGPNQQWKVEKLGSGRVRILSRLSNKVLDVAGASSDQGAPIVQYSWNGDRWYRVSGGLKWVDVGADGTVWGVNANDDIYLYLGDNNWRQIAGKLKQISVGSARHIWGVNSADNIYTWTGTGWQQVAGKLKHVGVGADGTVWGVNANDDIYRYLGNNNWQQIPGKLKQISVGNANHIWGVNSADNIYVRTQTSWQQVSGKLKCVAVSPSSVVWGVNANDDIYRYQGSNRWQQVPGKLKQISVGSAYHIFGTNSGDAIYTWGDARTLHQQWQLSTLTNLEQAYGRDSRATVYQHRNFQGNSQTLGIGSYNMNTLTIGNDTISSLRVPEGLKVTLYQHANFRGTTRSFGSDTAWVGDDFNDQASAIVVEPVISLYQHGNYGGRRQDFGVGRYNISDLRLGNDVASSIKVPQGLMATVYEHANYTGRYRIFTESTGWLGDDFNDIVSSLVVKAIGIEIPIGALKYGDKVVLRSAHNRYLVAESDGNLNANREAIGPWEEFVITRAGPSRYQNYVAYGDLIALKSAHNKYVVAESDGAANANRDALGAWEKWGLLRSGNSLSQVFVTPGDTITLLSSHGKYLVAESDGRANANRGAVGAWEKWTIRTRSLAVGSYNSGEGSGSALSVCGAEACASNVCGAEACGADACGAAACGAAASLVGACGAAAAVIAVCGADVCGAAFCGAEATGVGICGAAISGIGACGADACGADACGAAACGAAACGAALGGVSACGAAAGGIGACGADVCGAAACGAAACGAAACPAAACGADACGVDACGAEACGGDADVIQVCPADACAAEAGVIDACAADACAANTCVINACPADACAADACVVDVIPIVPGI